MSATFYKATRVDGTDFYSGTIDYAAAVGRSVRARSPKNVSYRCCSGDVLHAADVPTETLIGGTWSCRLFEVTGNPVASKGHKFGFRQLWVLREVDAHLALGPQGREVAALVERAKGLTATEVEQLAAAWAAARDAAWNAARVAAGDAAGAAAGALLVRDLVGTHGFTQTHYDTLTQPWATVVSPVHPDDQAVTMGDDNLADLGGEDA